MCNILPQVGNQKTNQPCVFHIIPTSEPSSMIWFCAVTVLTVNAKVIYNLCVPGVPDPPRRCAVGNRTISSLTFHVGPVMA